MWREPMLRVRRRVPGAFSFLRATAAGCTLSSRFRARRHCQKKPARRCLSFRLPDHWRRRPRNNTVGRGIFTFSTQARACGRFLIPDLEGSSGASSTVKSQSLRVNESMRSFSSGPRSSLKIRLKRSLKTHQEILTPLPGLRERSPQRRKPVAKEKKEGGLCDRSRHATLVRLIHFGVFPTPQRELLWQGPPDSRLAPSARSTTCTNGGFHK